MKLLIQILFQAVHLMEQVLYSFFKLLNDDVPHTILLRCICHSAALVASAACLALPRSPEELLRAIYI